MSASFGSGKIFGIEWFKGFDFENNCSVYELKYLQGEIKGNFYGSFGASLSGSGSVELNDCYDNSKNKLSGKKSIETGVYVGFTSRPFKVIDVDWSITAGVNIQLTCDISTDSSLHVKGVCSGKVFIKFDVKLWHVGVTKTIDIYPMPSTNFDFGKIGGDDGSMWHYDS